MRRFTVNPSGMTHVSGATLAQDHLKPLLDTLPPAILDPGEIVILDFSGTEVASASYIKATVVALIRDGQAAAEDERSGRNIFPVVAGISAEIAEELDAVLTANGLPCMEALAWDEARVIRGRLHGHLDPALQQTLAVLTAETVASATQLYEKHHSSIPITTTGWNNRLAQLHRVRLARRAKYGRQWRYTPIAEEVTRG